MSNVTNKIVFERDKADRIFQAVCPDGKFSFSKLIPSPYPQHVEQVDDGELRKWLDWNIKHWGTTYPAYSQAVGIENEKAYILFNNKHNIAYPILNKFAKKFEVDFEHHYIHEGLMFWGIEKWGTTPETGNVLWRTEIHRDLPKHKRMLCIELLGYDPEV